MLADAHIGKGWQMMDECVQDVLHRRPPRAGSKRVLLRRAARSCYDYARAGDNHASSGDHDCEAAA